MFRFLMKYPVNVLIAMRRGRAIQWVFDSATRMKNKDGTEEYHLKKMKTKIAPPDYPYLNVTKKGKPFLVLYSPQEGQFQGMKVTTTGNLIVEDKEMTNWKIMQTDKTYRIYASKAGFLEKYMPFIMIGVIGMLMFFMVIYIGDTFRELSGAANSIATTLKETAEVLAAGKQPGY